VAPQGDQPRAQAPRDNTDKYSDKLEALGGAIAHLTEIVAQLSQVVVQLQSRTPPDQWYPGPRDEAFEAFVTETELACERAEWDALKQPQMLPPVCAQQA
jgi:hypothetical protein